VRAATAVLDTFVVLFVCTERPWVSGDEGGAASLAFGPIDHAEAVLDLFRQFSRSVYALFAILLVPWLLTIFRGIFGLQPAHTVPSGSPDALRRADTPTVASFAAASVLKASSWGVFWTALLYQALVLMLSAWLLIDLRGIYLFGLCLCSLPYCT
jgi:hypothetical protein